MKVKGSLYWIYSFISGCKGKMLVAILLAVIGVLCGMAPYFALAGILSGLIQNTLTAERIFCYVGIAVLGETLKMLFNTVSSLKAHRVAYHILGNIRCKLAEKMMRVPMGVMVDTPSGKLKAMVVDTVDKLEQPLAHMLPEITANVFTPLYCYENDLPTTSKRPTDPYKWATKTVVHILERLDYLGHTVNFKTSKQSFKSKKVLWNDPADWVIFENTQEPIIEESVFLIVQKIRQGRRRPTKMGDMGMFSGLLFCADCGGKMYLCRANHFKPEQEYYLCSTYRKDRTLCSTHSIRRVVLEEIVLRNLREAIQYVTQYEDDFVQRAADQSLRERDKELAQKKDTLAQSQKRIAELDVIIKRLYEDNISGKLSDERFIKLSRDYELEQTNLTNLVEHLRQEVKEQEKQKVNVRQFIAAVRKYTDMQQLDAYILREFVDKIYISEVYTPDENEPRIKVREIEIVYNFIGAFDFEEAREQSQAAQKEKKTGVA